MDNKIALLLIGICGYGEIYLKEVLKWLDDSNIRLAGVVEVTPDNSPYLPQLKKLGIPVFTSIEEFYENGSADLAVISTPIHFHCYQTCYALAHGSNVLCEKPICATIQEAYKIMEERDKAEKFVAVGYQWSFSEPILKLKKDIISGLYGKPKRLKTIVLWTRDLKYYNRSWAGKKMDGEGRWILDSVANNATAHYLHNMFYLTGNEINRSGIPEYVSAELYRANNIENFDTSIINAILEDGTNVMFYASHASKEEDGIRFRYEFEKAVIEYSSNDLKCKGITATYFDGSKKLYGDPNADDTNKLRVCINAIEKGIEIPCGLEAAISHTLCINGAQESMPEIQNFSEELVKFNREAERLWVDGLGEILLKCYEDWKMPWEADIPWAVSGRKVDMKGYKKMPGL